VGRASWLTAYASTLCAQGLGPRLVRTFGQKLNYFYAYAMLQNLHKHLSGGQPLGVLMNLVIGSLGDVCCIFLVVPLELMSMRQSEGEGLLTMFRKIYSTSGIAGFYQVIEGTGHSSSSHRHLLLAEAEGKLALCHGGAPCVSAVDSCRCCALQTQGWTAYLFGSVMPAIQYTGFDQGKRFYLAWLANGSKTLSPAASFVLGAVSRAIADLGID
jgi:hypothetical protein